MTLLETSMREYAVAQAGRLLDELVFAIRTALKLQDPDSVHKMRVAIRRFMQALRVFRQYVPKSGRQAIARDLRVIMRAAGELRNRDIAVQLLGDAGHCAEALIRQRAQMKRAFFQQLRAVAHGNFGARWRKHLELPS